MSSANAFRPVPPELDFPKYEAAILALWREREIFAKSISQRDGGRRFVFYEGPPTANGLPHNGHVLTRVSKDLFPRYHTMLGAHAVRKGGWDTHGLPVEVEVEKELGIHGKEAINAYGVRPFVRRCIDSVFRYTAEWERLTERLGFWVTLEDAYVTYHKEYVESVWWALSELYKKGLLYQGHKVVWWWAQGGTALSAAEVGLGYKTVDDPSAYVLFPILPGQGALSGAALVVWTTTPWTLPSNGYAAVKAEVEYAVCRLEREEGAAPLACERVIVASALREDLAKKLKAGLQVERTLTGQELSGVRYRPPYDLYYAERGDLTVALKGGGSTHAWWRVITQDFVTLDSGTGVVHVAPAFGEDDHAAHKRELQRYQEPDQVELLCAVAPNGSLTEGLGALSGLWVKDADPLILKELASQGLLLHSEVYRHEYPFCWRAEQDPLIQMARPGWFIRTTERLDDAKANNQAISWLPSHIKDGRFGDFLDNNVDWALSRERFWGTPLNVWCCSACEARVAPASVQEILERNPRAFDHFHEDKKQDPTLSDHLMVHKPWIDEVTLPCAACGGEMRRVTEVIDCWFDSGCMPFAQWGYPHRAGSEVQFANTFPADFISEAIDQTRGWFYSLLMISTLVFDEATQARLGMSPKLEFPLPYKTCIVLGHVGDREGKKESKSRGNYTPPDIILDRVAMDFAVTLEAPGVTPEAGVVWIAREDLEGMDLNDGAAVAIYQPDAPGVRRHVVLKAHKRLPRRVAVVGASDCEALGLRAAPTGLNSRPVEVPSFPAETRVRVEDEATPAPGADAFRWFFYASGPPWSSTRHSLRNVRMLQKDFLVKLRNVYSFFTIYANIDGWRPSDAAAAQPEGLDRWMLSELELTTQRVRRAMDGYLAYDAAVALQELASSLSNWYLRRSRGRFWAPGLEADKRAAYSTLYTVLVELSKLCAPFVPFFSEEMYQNLVVTAGAAGAKESVHLEDYPAPRTERIDVALAEEMAAVRDIVSLGLRVRAANKLKVRQPLSRADVVLNDGALRERIAPYAPLIQEELNVHELRLMYPGHEEGAVSFKVEPNFRALGPRLGKQVQAVKRALAQLAGDALFAELGKRGQVTVALESGPIELSAEELTVSVSAAEGFAAETGAVGVVVLHTSLTEALIDEGYLREVLSRVQAARKEQRLEFTERVQLVLGGSERVRRVVAEHEAHIRSDCLAAALRWEEGEGGEPLGDERLSVRFE